MNVITKPLITTIIPTYRRPKLLRRAIKSVLNQTYPHFQVCVYDNASGDETAEVVAEFAKKDSRVKYYCHSENIGGIRNFKYGMEHVDTPFFSFLSDDDILLPEFYQTALQGFEKHPEAVFSACATVHLDDNGRITQIPLSNWREGLYLPPTGSLAMLRHYHPEWTGILFRREIIEKAGVLIDENVGLFSDLYFELHIAANFPIFISKRLGAIFWEHPSSTYMQKRLYDIWPSGLCMIRKLIEDERIDLSFRNQAKYILAKRLQEQVWLFGIRAILRENDEEFNKSLEILNNHFHSKRKVIFLKSFAKLCDYFPFIRQSARFLNKIRKSYKGKQLKQFQELYPEYSDLLYVVESCDDS